MTMIPAAQNLFKHQYCYGGGEGYVLGGCSGNFPDGDLGLMSRLEGYGCSEACLESENLVVIGGGQMADQQQGESRTESVNEAGSSSKDAHEDKQVHDDHQGWLQLSIGGGFSAAAHHNNTNNRNKQEDDQQADIDQSSRRGGMIELDLLPGMGWGSSTTTYCSEQLRSSLVTPMVHHVLPEFRAPSRPLTDITTPTLFLQHPRSTISTTFPHHQGITNWAFRPAIPGNIVSVPPPPSSSSLLVPLSPNYFARRPFQLHAELALTVGPAVDLRVIDPPRRPHSGIWFLLQAAQNQAKEPFLPQISKSFLRIKDGSMTIRLVMKYLVNKLKLDSESEVEIRCRGQQILPFLTLQHVRDNIWSQSDVVTLLPDSSTTDHMMVLHYGRRA